MKLPKLTPARRLWLYRVGVCVFLLFAGYNIVPETHVPLWTELLGYALGVGVAGTAATHLHRQRRDGIVPDEDGT